MTAKSEDLQNIPEEKVKPKSVHLKKKDKIQLLVDEIKSEYGIDVEPKKDPRYKFIKIINYLTNKYDFMFNTINTDIEYKLKESEDFKYFDDMDYIDVRLDLQMNCGMPVSKDVYETSLYSSSVSHRYNPFREYIFGLPAWDQKTDHIKHYLQQISLRSEDDRNYFINGFKKWFVALVMSLIEDIPDPFFINQTCLVFVGGQGKYKTTWLKRLLPRHLQLRYFYGSNFQTHNKDHEKYLATKIIINLDEMAALNKTDIESIKSKITQDQVVVRLPFARKDIHLKRRASFCGSINQMEFLKDDTGSRRWFIVEVDSVSLRDDFNPDLLFAQALFLYKEGFQYWFDSTDIEEMEKYNEKFKLKSMEEELILKHFSIPTINEIKAKSVEYMSATDISNFFSDKYTKINTNNTTIKNIGIILRRLGYEKRSRRLNDSETPVSLWCVKKVFEPTNTSMEEMATNNLDFPI